MKLLAFSDLHRNIASAQAIVADSARSDIVIGAGDFATMGRGIADTIDILRTITVPVVLVAGNHESVDDLRNACDGWTGVHILHGDSVTIDGQTFYGLGHEVAATSRAPWNSHVTEADAANLLVGCPAQAVLITHAPPYGIADQQADGFHDGSHAIRQAIEQRSLKLSLCGHIHNAWGSSGTINGCLVHNLGPRSNWFDI